MRKIFLKELIGTPTYLAGAVLANHSSTNMFGFFGLMAVIIVVYNLVYLQVFPRFEVDKKKFNLATFFFAQVAFWAAVYGLLYL